MSKMRDTVLSFAIMFLVWAPTARAQLGTFSGEQRIQFTPDWHGDRFADGRPRVPESVLVRLRDVTADEAWDILQEAGYRNQFESGWKVINPGQRLVGRVVTAVFLPHRPDVDSVIQTNGKKEARVGGENSWVIDILQPGDVLVVDLFGKIRYGTFAGDNLSTSIYAKSHNGLIVNGAVRDVSGIQQIKGFQCYVRGVDPSALENTMLMGINTPIRIGDVTVMPGDVALGDPEGVTFIPAQLAEKVADDTEMIHRVDEFNQWLKQKGSKLRMPLP